MFNALKENYGEFHDCLITEIRYATNFNYHDISKSGKREVEVFISCFNIAEDYQRQLIKIICSDVNEFKFGGYEGMIYSALLKNESDIFILDFFPIILDGDNLKEDPNSDCLIKCKAVSYVILE